MLLVMLLPFLLPPKSGCVRGECEAVEGDDDAPLPLLGRVVADRAGLTDAAAAGVLAAAAGACTGAAAAAAAGAAVGMGGSGLSSGSRPARMSFTCLSSAMASSTPSMVAAGSCVRHTEKDISVHF